MMEFYKGKKLVYQPSNLRYCLRYTLETEESNRLRLLRPEIHQWCDENFGMPRRTLVPVRYIQCWWWDLGKKYGYYFFETKDDAIKFKLVWG